MFHKKSKNEDVVLTSFESNPAGPAKTSEKDPKGLYLMSFVWERKIENVPKGAFGRRFWLELSSSGAWSERQLCYNLGMIRVICGGKKNAGAYAELIAEYEKRLRKPYETVWEFYDEERLAQKLANWPFRRGDEWVICCDERGENISSREYSERLTKAFAGGLDVVILVGGAYGFSPEVREKADFVWSFSKLVFPHQLFRVMIMEQIYRAQEIARGGKYHHE